MMQASNKRKYALEVAKSLLYKPYIWGGNDPITGFDCSGLMVEILQSVGIIERSSDFTANDLSDLFAKSEVLKAGNLVFYDWSLNGRMDHVELILDVLEDGTVLTIGASGGNQTTKTVADAMRADAYIKMRPLMDGYMKICDPFL